MGLGGGVGRILPFADSGLFQVRLDGSVDESEGVTIPDCVREEEGEGGLSVRGDWDAMGEDEDDA